MTLIHSIDSGPLKIKWVNADAQLDLNEMKQSLHQDEWIHSKRFKHQQRRLEFLSSRWLAHQEISKTYAILNHQKGFPIWPDSFTGSITHKNGFVATCIDSSESYLGIGIDLESITSFNSKLEKKICVPEESQLVDRLLKKYGNERTYWLTIMFSFKESLFKSLYPIERTFFYFNDAKITSIEPETDKICALLGKKTSAFTPLGHFCHGFFHNIDLFNNRLILTSTYEKRKSTK